MYSWGRIGRDRGRRGWRLVHYHHRWRGMVMMRKMVMMGKMVMMRMMVMVGHVGTDTSVHCLVVLGISSYLEDEEEHMIL